MSADDGCGRWVVGVVVRRGEGVAEGVDGPALEENSDAGVDADGDADVGVAEEFLDDYEVDALFKDGSLARAVARRRSVTAARSCLPPGGPAASRTPMLAAWRGAVTMEMAGLMPVRG
ncbi:hypothetical protein QZH56_10415 [Streptomyces olivoreticuli]|uniref:hypothetical protein n=1 Tax=Streptomyces olivoreticuli TaxID=68246 RepID=UPI002658883A|nr:hypothetical protein [Streptomyces olivoreticuli]WKK25967.1 hypothetical protein QZH56_10415 [Streptomyces olivoreticuli]